MADTIFDKSVFKPHFDANDAQVQEWTDNVLDKLEQPGQVAKYIKRVNDNQLPTDFLSLFRPIVKFHAYLVRLAREFRDFKLSTYLANAYLNQDGQYTSSQESLAQLQYLITNLWRTRRERGALGMIKRSVDTTPHGEVLRLLNWDAQKFFKLGIARPERNGWNVNNCSPLNRSNTGRYDLNIGWEYTEDVQSLTPYPLLNGAYVNIAVYRGRTCIQIEGAPFGTTAGIGAVDLSKAIVVDPRVNYEITFYVAQDFTAKNISFGCRAFDALGSEVSLNSVINGAARKWFFETRRLNKAGRFYQVRGIVFNKDIDVMSAADARLNIGFGSHLKMNDNVVYIIPYIVMDNNVADDSDAASDTFDSDSLGIDLGKSGSDESGPWVDAPYDGQPSVYLWNIKVTPCNTPYNRCYLNNKHFIDVFYNNLSGQFSDEQIDVILRKHFIPYDTAFNTIHIGEITEVNPDVSALLLESGDYILLESEDRILLEQQ